MTTFVYCIIQKGSGDGAEGPEIFGLRKERSEGKVDLCIRIWYGNKVILFRSTDDTGSLNLSSPVINTQTTLLLKVPVVVEVDTITGDITLIWRKIIQPSEVLMT